MNEGRWRRHQKVHRFAEEWLFNTRLATVGLMAYYYRQSHILRSELFLRDMQDRH